MSKRESQYVDIVQEFMNRAYIDGRNAAKNHLPDEVPDEYVVKEEQEYRFSV